MMAGLFLLVLCIALPFPGVALVAETVGASVMFSAGLIQLLEILSHEK